ncbi:MAG TPA: hypothetical protein PK156_48900 [Polyangium sp.]|nr:hypothetical protein [Polyangium sp.]
MVYLRKPLLSFATVAFLQVGCGLSVTPPASTLPVMAQPTISVPENESDPMTHVKRLPDVATRTFAIRHLRALTDDAMAQDNGDPNGPHIKPLADKIIEPLTNHCTTGAFDEVTNSTIMTIVARMADLRGESCLLKTIERYTPGVPEEILGTAIRAWLATKSRSGNLSLDVVFKLRASYPYVRQFGNEMREALLASPDPSWETACIAVIEDSRTSAPLNATDEHDSFPQETCIRILGRMKSEKAIKPLIKTLLSVNDPSLAKDALMDIGRPTIAPLAAVLRGDDKELLALAQANYLANANQARNAHRAEEIRAEASYSHVHLIAPILASIQSDDARIALLDAIAKGDEVVKVLLVIHLQDSPSSSTTVAVVKRVIEQTPEGLRLPYHVYARPYALSTLHSFYDSNLVPWLVRLALTAKGPKKELQDMHMSALYLAQSLMRRDQVSEVEKLVRRMKQDREVDPQNLESAFESFQTAKELLDKCKEAIDCYFQEFENPDVRLTDDPKKRQMEEKYERLNKAARIRDKSIHMIGLLGGNDDPVKLVELASRIPDEHYKYQVLRLIDHRLPKGDPIVVAKLQAMLDALSPVRVGRREEWFQRELANLIRKLKDRAESKP